MKYEVKMSCGHVETVELFGKTADRERKIAWLEKNGICEECKKAEREAADRAAAESAKENGWVELKGSEKQIAWAESIRAEKMAEMGKMPAANDQTNFWASLWPHSRFSFWGFRPETALHSGLSDQRKDHGNHGRHQ